MSTEYARQVQLADGNSLQARDLKVGDVILIRRRGAEERTPERIVGIAKAAMVTLYFEDADGTSWNHECSPRMTVGVMPKTTEES